MGPSSSGMQIVDKVWRRYLLGCLLTVVLMVPIGYIIFQVFPLLGYDDPKEAPFLLGTAVLIVILLVLVIVIHFAAGDSYDELQERRLNKKKRVE